MNKKSKKMLIVVFCILSLLLSGCASLMYEGGGYYTYDKDTQFEHSTREDIADIEDEISEEFTSGDILAESVTGNLEIHYLNVGQADSTLIKCGDEVMLIDGGNAEDSGFLYTYLKEQNVKHIDYIICTHAHEDHVGGLAGALNAATVGIAYCPTEEYDTKVFENFVKYLGKQEVSITVPKVGTEFYLGGAKCTILGVNTCETDEPNNTSIVMKIVYGDTSFLFSGDAEQCVETAILDAGHDISCDVIKVPHHGSDTSLTYRWLREAAPQYGVISVGNGNSYGHPTEATLSKLRDAEVKTLRTDIQGTIICYSDGKNLSFAVDKNGDEDTFLNSDTDAKETEKITEYNPDNGENTEDNTDNDKIVEDNTGSGKITYILNTSSKKIHYPDCPSAEKIKEENRKETNKSMEELIAEGYSPCGNCKP